MTGYLTQFHLEQWVNDRSGLLQILRGESLGDPINVRPSSMLGNMGLCRLNNNASHWIVRIRTTWSDH